MGLFPVNLPLKSGWPVSGNLKDGFATIEDQCVSASVHRCMHTGYVEKIS